MSKATFVSEIPDKIEGNEVPTLNLVKSMLTSENISDRIPEFNLRDVSGTEKYTVNGKDVSELSDVCYVGRGGPYMNANQSVLFKESVYTNHTVKLEYGGEVVSINSSNYESYTRGASVGNFQVAESKGEFVIGVDSNNNPTGIYKISVSFENGQKYEIEKQQLEDDLSTTKMNYKNELERAKNSFERSKQNYEFRKEEMEDEITQLKRVYEEKKKFYDVSNLKRIESIQQKIDRIKRPEDLQGVLRILQKYVPQLTLSSEVVIEGRLITKQCVAELRNYLNSIPL